MFDLARASRLISTECPCVKLRQASRALTRTYDEALRPSGLQMAQLSVLVAVARFGDGGATMTALAAALVLERTTLTRNLAPLARDGLLRIDPSPHDARSRLVTLTASGSEALEAAFPLWQVAQRQVRARLGGAAVDALLVELQPVVSGGDPPSASRRGPKAASTR